MNKPLSKALITELGQLADQDRERVLSYVRSLAAARVKGTRGSTLMKFAGSIPKSELETMRHVIEQDCARIDQEGW